MNKDLDYLLIKKILFSNKNKNKLIRDFILIILIVSLLIVATIFINSMSIGIANKFSLLVNGDIEVYNLDNNLEDYDFIYSIDTVSRVNALVYGKDNTQITTIKAVEPSYFNDKRLKALNLNQIENTTNLLSLFISQQTANLLNLKLGDKAAIVISNSQDRIRPKLVFISGIFDTRYKEIDQNLSFMNLQDASKILNDDLSIHNEVLIKDNYDLTDAIITLKIDNFLLRAWYELQPSVYNNLLVSTQSLMIVFIVIALLTGYFISSISSDIITKDHKNIAINKLLGLRNKAIRKIYFVAIELFTIISTIIGIFLGIIVSKVFLQFISKLSFSDIPALSWYLFDFDIIIPVNNLILISLSLILVSMISVYFSLTRIRKIETLDLLNHE